MEIKYLERHQDSSQQRTDNQEGSVKKARALPKSLPLMRSFTSSKPVLELTRTTSIASAQGINLWIQLLEEGFQ